MSHFSLLSLPDIVIEHIFSYLSYDEIARFRETCKRLDLLCKMLLNKGFVAAERFHSQSIKALKVQLPRRESERRLHPMARHCDILSAIETRLSMLSITYTKYIDVGLCCFIPGKVIDEIFKVLKFLKTCKTPPRAHEILQELRDISAMAMEHFEEKIAPALKNNRYSDACSSNQFSSHCSNGTCGSSHSARPFLTQDKLRLEFRKSHYRDQKLRRKLQLLETKVNQDNGRISTQAKKLSIQAKKLSSQAVVIAEQDTQIGELKRTVGDLVAELSCVREENAVLAASLGIVFNRNNSSQEVSMAQPCISRSCEGSKRKCNDNGETMRVSKMTRLGMAAIDISPEKESNIANTISILDNVASSDCGSVPECL